MNLRNNILLAILTLVVAAVPALAQVDTLVTQVSNSAFESYAGSMSAGQGYAVVSYMRRVWAKVEPMPKVSDADQTAALVAGRYCASCHMLDGEGASSAPDLTTIGRTRDATWLKEWITDPSLVDPVASMPAFGETLSEAEMNAIVAHLATRK